INQFEPKFYLSEKGGMDISYEFNTSLATAEVIPFTINNGETKDFNFNASHNIPYSQGVTVIDAYVEYSKEGESDNLRFIRYQSGSGDWNLITSQQKVYERNIISNMTSADIPPSYLLHPLKVCDNKSNSSCKDFLNGSSIGKDKIMSLEFVDVSTIDESTISLMRGNNFLFQKEEISVDSNNFMLDQSTNLLKFYVGDEDATISLSLKDLSGNDMPMTALNYLISEETEVTHPLFYPNPYVLGNDNLKFNYSVSKDNTKVSMYIYNHLGLLVYQSSEIVNSGSNTMSLSETEEFMVPGIFICRLIAEVDGKVVSSKTTRLAIY
ncbi:MAG: T9SS type A sorting domain-containing protein, partial [Candidatus Kariarchaeum pelagius]